MTDTPPKPPTPLEVLELRQKEIACRAKSEESQAKWTTRWYWISGACGLAGSAVAAATASFGPKVIPVVAGVVGALGSGFAAFFHFDGRAAGHEKNSSKLGSVAEHAQNRLAGLQATTPDVDQKAAVDALDEV